MRVGLVLAGIATVLAGCDNRREEQAAAKAAADSFAEMRRQGKYDLSNPEAGWKVLVTLTAESVFVSHPSITSGQVTFGIINKAARPLVAEVKGQSGDWKTMPIRPNESVLLATLIEPGTYEVLCSDSAGGRNACGRTAKFEVTQRAFITPGAPADTAPKPLPAKPTTTR